MSSFPSSLQWFQQQPRIQPEQTTCLLIEDVTITHAAENYWADLLWHHHLEEQEVHECIQARQLLVFVGFPNWWMEFSKTIHSALSFTTPLALGVSRTTLSFYHHTYTTMYLLCHKRLSCQFFLCPSQFVSAILACFINTVMIFVILKEQGTLEHDSWLGPGQPSAICICHLMTKKPMWHENSLMNHCRLHTVVGSSKSLWTNVVDPIILLNDAKHTAYIIYFL